MARKWIYDRVMSCPLASTTYGSRVFAPGGTEGPGGQGDSPGKPFMSIRAATNNNPVRGSGVKQQRFQVYVHDMPGDTTNIDDMVQQLENHVPMDSGERTAEGWFMRCEWEDTSGDGFDDHYGTTVRYVSFLVTWRPAVQS